METLAEAMKLLQYDYLGEMDPEDMEKSNFRIFIQMQLSAMLIIHCWKNAMRF